MLPRRWIILASFAVLTCAAAVGGWHVTHRATPTVPSGATARNALTLSHMKAKAYRLIQAGDHATALLYLRKVIVLDPSDHHMQQLLKEISASGAHKTAPK